MGSLVYQLSCHHQGSYAVALAGYSDVEGPEQDGTYWLREGREFFRELERHED